MAYLTGSAGTLAGLGRGAAAWLVVSAIVAMVANRPASAYSVRSMIALTGSVRGSASSCPAVWPCGASRCAIGLVAWPQ